MTHNSMSASYELPPSTPKSSEYEGDILLFLKCSSCSLFWLHVDILIREVDRVLVGLSTRVTRVFVKLPVEQAEWSVYVYVPWPLNF